MYILKQLNCCHLQVTAFILFLKRATSNLNGHIVHYRIANGAREREVTEAGRKLL
jgi:hypothetical protein